MQIGYDEDRFVLILKFDSVSKAPTQWPKCKRPVGRSPVRILPDLPATAGFVFSDIPSLPCKVFFTAPGYSSLD